jgi:hypothetical protein
MWTAGSQDAGIRAPRFLIRQWVEIAVTATIRRT